ncbi:unnamed protein product [Ectocarpus sp. CCAP 1310/34]|nr:unnamed protein product [Ectocarpus sp. CCAP 1310/34]
MHRKKRAAAAASREDPRASPRRSAEFGIQEQPRQARQGDPGTAFGIQGQQRRRKNMWEKYWTEMEYGHLREKNDAPAGAMAAGRTTAGAAGGAGLGTQRVSMKNDGNCALSGYSSSRNPPKIPTNSTKAVSWLRRMRNFLAVEDLERTLDHMPSTGYVNVISCLDRTYLNQTHGAHLVAAHQRAWGYMLEATCGTDIEERLGACDCVPEAWSVIHEWLLPTLDAEKTLLVRRLETIEMHPGEDPKLFFARVDGVINIMKAVGIEKSERAIVHIIVRQLAHEYDIERKSILADPTISRAKVENVVRAAYANKVMMKELGKAQAAPAAAVTVGGLGSGHGGHGQGGLQRRWRQQREQQQWHVPVGDGEGLNANGNDAMPHQQRKRRRWRRQRHRQEAMLPVFAAGAVAWGTVPAAGAATVDGGFPTTVAGGTVGGQALAAGAAASTAAPAARAATPGSRVFPAAAAGETAGAQALAAGAAAWTAAPAARAATPGSRVLPAAAVWEPVGTQGIAAKASAAQEPEDECDEDSCWLGHGDEGGNSSDGSGDGGIGALSAGARHPGAHPTVSNGIYVVRDDGG